MRFEGLWQVTEDIGKYSDQFLHCGHTDTFVMTGHRPLIRFGRRRAVLGTLRFYGKTGLPLDQAAHYTSRVRAGEAGWEVADALIRVSSPENTTCAGVYIRSSAALRVRFGGVHYAGDGLWNVMPGLEGNYAAVPFDDAWKGERYEKAPGGYRVYRDEVDGYLTRLTGKKLTLWVTASFPLRLEDGMLSGACAGEGYMCLSLCGEGETPMDPKAAYERGRERADALCQSLSLHTPDPAIDALCAWRANLQDGIWYPPRNMHSDMTWNMPYLGWTNRYGNDVRGWHERTLEEVRYYSSRQIKEDKEYGPAWRADDHLGTVPAQNSRFYGKGYVAQDQFFYNMQAQFFDQAIHSWRMTGDEELEKTLYPMLALHCQWMDECFDPDGDGGYESVIDTWPTDSVWCDGGAAPESTCYALRAHMACADMARRAGDIQAEGRHRDICAKISRAFFDLLWMRDQGIAGRCREQVGRGRILANPWSYSAFLPIDVGLLDPIQAAQSLYYTKWAYQNDSTENGRLVWHSNMVPMIWSVRWQGAEEQWMLAHAAFMAGFPEEGLSLLHGLTDTEYSLNGREVLEGLFGYRPDYPNGRVLISASMPYAWHDASAQTKDARIVYHRDGSETSLEFTLFKEAEVTVELFAYADEILSAEGGSLRLIPGFGRTKAHIRCGRAMSGRVVLRTRGERAPVQSLEIDARPGEDAFLPCPFRPLAVHDPQGMIAALAREEDGIRIRVSEKSGNHWLCLEKGGDMPEYRVYHLNVSPTRQEQEVYERLHAPMPEDARYEAIDIRALFNCDVRDIYRQKYLSPRPQTISARIGVDGYSPWTFSFWASPVPEIRLERTGEVPLPGGGSARVSEGDKNIAFASLWDNFPDEISLPVNDRARGIVLLLCGTTNPMQSGVENARLTFTYQDGQREEVPVKNPDQFWSLCPLMAHPTAMDQGTSNDYDYDLSPFCLPRVPPETVQLGGNCRAVALRWRLRDEALASVTLSCVARDVVIGIMAATLIK